MRLAALCDSLCQKPVWETGGNSDLRTFASIIRDKARLAGGTEHQVGIVQKHLNIAALAYAMVGSANFNDGGGPLGYVEST
jgi:hypothetical protein